MKVLVTGVTGFVGSNLVDRLLNSGYHVKAIVRNPQLITNPDIEIIIGDIRDETTVNKAIQDCQQVYHLAGVTSRTKSNSSDFWSINSEATRLLGDFASKYNVQKFVYGSTIGVYGITKSGILTETSPTNPNTIYRQTKLAGETALLELHQQQKLPLVIARLTSMLGDNGRNWLGLVKALQGKTFKFLGAGDNVYNVVHVQDAVRALQLCGESSAISNGQCYNIGHHYQTTFKEFVSLITEQLEIDFPAYNNFTLPFQACLTIDRLAQRYFNIGLPFAHRYEVFLTSRQIDVNKAKKDLEFIAQLSPRQGVADMINSLRSNGDL